MSDSIAWIVRDYCEGVAVVVFHHHRPAAKRIGSERLGIDFECADIERKRDYDEYSDAGGVPQSVLIDDGWFFECTHCGLEVSEDNFCDEGLELNDVVTCGSDSVYCSQKCKDEHNKEKELQNNIFNET